MGNCCSTEPKPIITHEDRSQGAGEKSVHELEVLSQSLQSKQKDLQEVKEAYLQFSESLKRTQEEIVLISQEISKEEEGAQVLYSTCIRLLIKISILQTLSRNIESDEFRSLLALQSADEIVLALLSQESFKIGKHTRSLIIAEITNSTLRMNDEETDAKAISLLRKEKEQGELAQHRLTELCIRRGSLETSISNFHHLRSQLAKSASIFSNDLLFLKDRRQEFLVRNNFHDAELRKLTKGLSPVKMLEDLLFLEEEDFHLAADIAGLTTAVPFCETLLKSTMGKESRTNKLLERINQIPVPDPLPRSSVTLRGIRAKVVSSDSEVDLGESEEAAEDSNLMPEEVQSLETRLESAKANIEASLRLSVLLEGEIEQNDFIKAETTLKIVVTRLAHKLKMERIWLFSEWRLKSVERKFIPSPRASLKLTLG